MSGIGCSSRFPYYMDTYGFHGIHGRAPAIATGVKLSRPDLQVWVITGDGDALSIGGNHFLHVIRRNLDVKVILFNNQIYGLTKGQYSPTSPVGARTKSTPYGSVDRPVNPLCVAIGAEATFVARSVDVDIKHLTMVLERAAHHKGTAFVEVYQDCNVFNSGAFNYASKKEEKDDNIVYLEHGKPLIFGKNRNKGIRISEMSRPGNRRTGRRRQGGRSAVPRRKGARAVAGLPLGPHAAPRVPRADGRLPRRPAAHLRRGRHRPGRSRDGQARRRRSRRPVQRRRYLGRAVDSKDEG